MALMMAAYFMSFVDRTILSLLVDPIKRSLSLSDTEIGLLQGAFGIFFMIATFPAGWVADKSNRMRLVGCGVACWSVATALCGACSSFVQLFVARMGVAVGEASLQPTAPSVISDNFPPERRAVPLSVFTLGGGMGASVSLIAGGFIASLVSGRAAVTIPGVGAFEPWQIIFFAVASPGLLVSLLFFFAPEPRRREQHQTDGSLGELGVALRARWTVLLPYVLGVACEQIFAYAYTGWAPVFFMRVHGWSLIDVGLKWGVVQLVSGIIGAILGGWLTRTLWRRGRRDAYLLGVAISIGVMAAPGALGALVPSPWAAAALFGLATVCMQGKGGPMVGTIQELMPNRLRARVTALFYAVLGLLGMTLGPIVVGVLNDRLFTGPTGVARSLSLLAVLSLPLGTALVLLAARNRRRLAVED